MEPEGSAQDFIGGNELVNSTLNPEIQAWSLTKSQPNSIMTNNMTNIAELKANLSDFVARAERGEEILISRHNRPVAKLIPLKASIPSKRGSLLGAYSGLSNQTDPFWDGLESPITPAEVDELGERI